MNNFNIELKRTMRRGVAIAFFGVDACMMGRLLLRSSMRLIGLADQLSVHIWQDGDHRGRESEETIVDRSTDYQTTTSEKRTKALLPTCPLFGGSTVMHQWNMSIWRSIY